METSSFFIEGKAMFGSYPTQESVDILEEEGVRCFVNLTHEDETKIAPYTTKYKYISFPIADYGIPTDRFLFTKFIYQLCETIRSLPTGELVYIHCKGGHGRAGIVVSCVISEIFSVDTLTALRYTSECHSKRSVMRDKWRRIGSPQTTNQKQFVHDTFRECFISNRHVLSMSSNYSVTINGIQYSTALEAFDELFKEDTTKNKIDLLRRVMTLRMEQHPGLKETLIHTYLMRLHSFHLVEFNSVMSELRKTFYL
jgi:hypothetical protein